MKRMHRWKLAWTFDTLNILQFLRLLSTRGHYTIDLVVGVGAGILFDSIAGKYEETKKLKSDSISGTTYGSIFSPAKQWKWILSLDVVVWGRRRNFCGVHINYCGIDGYFTTSFSFKSELIWFFGHSLQFVILFHGEGCATSWYCSCIAISNFYNFRIYSSLFSLWFSTVLQKNCLIC